MLFVLNTHFLLIVLFASRKKKIMAILGGTTDILASKETLWLNPILTVLFKVMLVKMGSAPCIFVC